MAIEPGVSSLLVGDFTPNEGARWEKDPRRCSWEPARDMVHTELSPALHGVLVQCGTRIGGTRAQGQPRDSLCGDKLLRTSVCWQQGGGNKDPVPRFEASWKMKVCPRAAGD